MRTICKWSCVCAIAAFMLLAISPSASEAGKRRRYRSAHVVHAAPVYVIHAAPVYVAPAPAIYRHHRPAVHVVAPAVRVHVGGYRGVSVNVGRRGW
jgi:hypothetical protein